MTTSFCRFTRPHLPPLGGQSGQDQCGRRQNRPNDRRSLSDSIPVCNPSRALCSSADQPLRFLGFILRALHPRSAPRRTWPAASPCSRALSPRALVRVAPGGTAFKISHSPFATAAKFKFRLTHFHLRSKICLLVTNGSAQCSTSPPSAGLFEPCSVSRS